MSEPRFRRRWLLMTICSIWPLVPPMLWYTASIRSLRRANSPDVIASLPEASRAAAVRLNTFIESMMIRAVMKFGITMLLLSVATCLLVAKRLKSGSSSRGVSVGVTILAALVALVSAMAAVIRGDLSLSLVQPQPTVHFWPSLFPAWCVLAAGLSFAIALRYSNEKQEAA